MPASNATRLRSPARRKPRTVTERLDSSSRRVGPLSIFGITDLWRVPTILPKRLVDFRRPLTASQPLRHGDFVCLGGRAVSCQLIDRVERPPSQDVVDAQPMEESSASTDEVLADDAPAQDVCDDVDVDGSTGHSPSPELNGQRWRFELVDIAGHPFCTVEVDVRTRSDADLVTFARGGDAFFIYGQVLITPDRHWLVEAQLVLPSEIGEIHAFYPSKTRREYKPATKRRGRSSISKGSWIVRKMSSATVRVLVRDKNRFAIARCAAVLRERLGLRSAVDEWDLMRIVSSPSLTLEATLKAAHSPATIEEGLEAARALERLVAIEVLQKVHAERHAFPPKRLPVRCTAKHLNLALERLRSHGRIQLTSEQHLAVTEILADLNGPRQTHRLLSGDVGSGKTAVFGIVAAAVHYAGHLVVILEPRSQLAAQVHRKLSAYFPDIPMQLITGSSPEAAAIQQGIIVGTTGVWSRMAAGGCSPTLIVADEQHLMGVRQRKPYEFADANILESTATAIPRTQGLIEFGGIEVSVLRHGHVRKTIITRVLVGPDEMQQAYEEVIDKVLHESKNLILVFPVIDAVASDGEDIPKAIAESVSMWDTMFYGQIGVIHGRMADEERTEVLRRFEQGDLSVLIGTSILEVGIDLPKADVMVVHQPERLGVAGVHQLRGRLARQGGTGWCYLACSSSVSDAQLEVLRLMESEFDGFKLALADMQRRGFGDMRVHAKQQSGTYMGFLVDRPPSVSDLDWAVSNCSRWIADDTADRDLLDDGLVAIDAMSSLAAPPPKAPRLPSSPEVVAEQFSLFSDAQDGSSPAHGRRP